MRIKYCESWLSGSRTPQNASTGHDIYTPQGMTLCHFQQEKVGKTLTDTQGHQQL